jgi:hypothetical protein
MPSPSSRRLHPAAIRRLRDGEPGGLRLLDGETLALAVRIAFAPREG